MSAIPEDLEISQGLYVGRVELSDKPGSFGDLKLSVERTRIIIESTANTYNKCIVSLPSFLTSCENSSVSTEIYSSSKQAIRGAFINKKDGSFGFF